MPYSAADFQPSAHDAQARRLCKVSISEAPKASPGKVRRSLDRVHWRLAILTHLSLELELSGAPEFEDPDFDKSAITHGGLPLSELIVLCYLLLILRVQRMTRRIPKSVLR